LNVEQSGALLQSTRFNAALETEINLVNSSVDNTVAETFWNEDITVFSNSVWVIGTTCTDFFVELEAENASNTINVTFKA
jgi:hypothetical protein